MSDTSYHYTIDCQYKIRYHIIWCPKFDFSILDDNAPEKIKIILFDICDRYHYLIKTIEVMPDHIHLFLDVPHTVAPNDIARTLKSLSTVALFQNYPILKKFYTRHGVLWTPQSLISSDESIDQTTIEKYIEKQANVPDDLL